MVLVDIISTALQTLLDFVYYLIPRSTPAQAEIKSVRLVAHRGWHDNDKIQENSWESFEQALKHNLFGIEFDIRWTKDLVPVIHHDSNLSRIWGHAETIADLTFTELREFCPQVPSLEEVVSHFGGKIHFFVELKDEHFPNPLEQKKTLQHLLKGLTPKNDFHIMCLKMGPINVFDMYEKKAYLLVADFNIFQMSKLALMHKLGGVTGHYLLCSADVLAKHRELDQKVGTGFIRTVNCLKREINRDVEWIFTNHPWNLLPFIESADLGN